MSQFLPEGTQQQTPQGTPTTFGDSTEVSADDVKLMQRIFAAAAQNPTMVPDTFLSYVLDWLQVNNLQIPIGQVFGFQKFLSTQVTVYTAADNGAGTVTATTYSDLTGATAGPEIDSLPDGAYVILFGAGAGPGVTATETALVSVSVNGASAVDADAAQSQSSAITSIARGLQKNLSNGGNNSLKLMYREVGGGTGTFSFRWIIAIRYANL